MQLRYSAVLEPASHAGIRVTVNDQAETDNELVVRCNVLPRGRRESLFELDDVLEVEMLNRSLECRVLVDEWTHLLFRVRGRNAYWRPYHHIIPAFGTDETLESMLIYSKTMNWSSGGR